VLSFQNGERKFVPFDRRVLIQTLFAWARRPRRDRMSALSLTLDQWVVTVGFCIPAPLLYWLRWKRRTVPGWLLALSYFSALWLGALIFAFLLSRGWVPGIWALMYLIMSMLAHHLLAGPWPASSKDRERTRMSGGPGSD